MASISFSEAPAFSNSSRSAPVSLTGLFRRLSINIICISGAWLSETDDAIDQRIAYRCNRRSGRWRCGYSRWRIRQYAPAVGGSVECTVTAEDDILIARLAANLSDVRRIDLSICNDAGIEQGRLRDIPFRPGASSVIWQESITFAKAAPTNRLIYRLVSVDETGSDHPLCEYKFNHTRSLPGPGEWLRR
jgi:hypothetical protein